MRIELPKEGNVIFVIPKKLPQYTITTLTPVRHQLIVKLKFWPKQAREDASNSIACFSFFFNDLNTWRIFCWPQFFVYSITLLLNMCKFLISVRWIQSMIITLAKAYKSSILDTSYPSNLFLTNSNVKWL